MTSAQGGRPADDLSEKKSKSILSQKRNSKHKRTQTPKSKSRTTSQKERATKNSSDKVTKRSTIKSRSNRNSKTGKSHTEQDNSAKVISAKSKPGKTTSAKSNPAESNDARDGRSAEDEQYLRAEKADLYRNIPVLLKTLDTQYENLKFCRAGGNNIVFTFSSKATASDLARSFVIRTPLRLGGELSSVLLTQAITKQVEILHFLRQQPSLKDYIPEVTSFDSTNKNPINRPYIIMRCMDGKAIDDWLEAQTPDQCKHLAEIIGEVVLKIESVEFERIGELENIGMAESVSELKGIEIVNFRTPHQKVEMQDKIQRPTGETLHDLLSARIQNAIRRYKLCRTQREDLFLWRMLDIMLKDMTQLQFFKDFDTSHPIVLLHDDFFARNLMISDPKEQSFEVTAVLDWDAPRAVPRVLARRPPAFLWMDNSQQLTNGALWDNTDFFADDQFNPVAELEFIKDHFDAYMNEKDPTYLGEAYGHGLWVRRLTTLVLSGLEHDQYKQAVHWLQREWSWEFYRITHNLDVDGFPAGEETPVK